ncbi:hypothetical protein A5791_10360 [Mycobacterium sp. 852002-51163_SCH5372311]|uniref:hypothetical protein n=1 Tax=Mycobacterium sp. 852002-51163_SCH5372311 TaxID=1834097 RepID=UPI0008021375|nr:hypothetical protein [Mycobacterium sp. 852002-51163_SCH5372311]OBF79877.1 hypothetical protein A5791_10360 [Mycobacterium sp. 852002-51163_SCH5372311]
MTGGVGYAELGAYRSPAGPEVVWVAPGAGIAELHAAFLAVKLADTRRYAVSSRVCGDMNSLEPLPPNATAAAPQTRAHAQREWRGTDFHGFLLSIEEQWAAEDISAVNAEMLDAMSSIIATAKADARKAAEDTDDGYLEVEVPELFGEKYANALAELDHEPTVTEHRAVQQRLLLEESGGRRPSTT